VDGNLTGHRLGNVVVAEHQHLLELSGQRPGGDVGNRRQARRALVSVGLPTTSRPALRSSSTNNAAVCAAGSLTRPPSNGAIRPWSADSPVTGPTTLPV